MIQSNAQPQQKNNQTNKKGMKKNYITYEIASNKKNFCH
jgi:hypothetical protein